MNKMLDSAVALFVIGIILLIIIPLSPMFLDMMIIFNLSLAMVILLTTMYLKETLKFSIFPSLLLITTLFRAALNVSSTRLILGNSGEAGQVIKTFGEFVIGGNAVVGVVIFIIIMCIQFIVITKGSERVAEVAARFTLDAMPGKQMAIDADLNSGLINEVMARERRLTIQREADFFGAMDGASKFVKGDAIVSIIITFINIIGGSIIGLVAGGKTVAEVLTIYTVATVGDGLVTQIPALLISTATAMMVTRAASENSLSQNLSRQILSQPVVLTITGAMLYLLCLIPGFPRLLLISVGSLLIFLGNRLRAGQAVEVLPETEEADAPVSESSFYRNVENIYTLLAVEPIEMEFGYSLIPLVDEAQGGGFVDRVVMFRRQFATEMGMVVPSVRLRDNGQLNSHQYVIKIRGEEVARGEVLVGHYLAMDPSGSSEPVDGIETVEPAFGIPAKWISEQNREMAEIYGHTIIDPLSVIVTHLSEVIKVHAHELLSRQDVNNLLDNAKKNHRTLVEEVVPGVVSLGDLQRILANLLREQVPIKDMSTILETLGDYGQTSKDTDVLTEYVRQSLRRTITRRVSSGGQLKVISIDVELEKTIMGSVRKTEHGSYMAIEPDLVQKIVAALHQEAVKMRDLMHLPIILTSPMVRLYLKKMLEQFEPGITVLSYSEIESAVQIQSVGTVRV